jgi:hypothetical protein
VLERLATTIATLVRPSEVQPGLAGVRGATTQLGQPLTYVAGAVHVALHVAPERATEGRLAMRGLVRSSAHTGEALTRSRVDLLEDEAIIATADLTVRGHFTLVDLPAGEYAVQISFPDYAVVIPSVALKL